MLLEHVRCMTDISALNFQFLLSFSTNYAIMYFVVFCNESGGPLHVSQPSIAEVAHRTARTLVWKEEVKNEFATTNF